MKRREFMTLLGSAVASWPLPARAQQAKDPVIGWLSLAPGQFWWPVDAFRQGLAEAGYFEGRNVTIEFRLANQGPPLSGKLRTCCSNSWKCGHSTWPNGIGYAKSSGCRPVTCRC